MRCLHISYLLAVWWKRGIDADTLLQFLYPLSVFKKHPKSFYLPSFVTQLPRELCHEAVFKKETEEDTMSTHFAFPHCLMKKGNRCGYTSTLSVLSLGFQKTSEVLFPAQLRDTITAGFVSRGCLQKRNRRGYEFYTCRIPALSDEKGKTSRILFYTLCIHSVFTKITRSRSPYPGQ